MKTRRSLSRVTWIAIALLIAAVQSNGQNDPSSTPSPVEFDAKLRAGYKKAAETVTKEVRTKVKKLDEQYDAGLEHVLRFYSEGGDSNGAVAVLEERERIKNFMDLTDAQVEGTGLEKLREARVKYQRSLAKIESEGTRRLNELADAGKAAFERYADQLTRERRFKDVQKAKDLISAWKTEFVVKEEEPCEVFLICDNTYDFCVNGVSVINGDSKGQFTRWEVVLRKGDVITVKLGNTGLSYGFACIIKRPNAEPIVTDAKTWKCYEPRSTEEWADPMAIGATRKPGEGTNKAWKSKIEFETNLECESIWGNKPETKGYLTFRIQD